MQIPVNQIQKEMIIDDGDRLGEVLVKEVWPDHGNGLGVVIKGQHVSNGALYFRRFLDPEKLVEVNSG